MRTFITTLTTDQSTDFSSMKYDQLSLGSQAIHLVRQCLGIKYLKVVYGDDLWFMYRLYHNDLEMSLTSFKNRVKQFGSKNDVELTAKINYAITLCDNALFDTPLSPILLDDEILNLFYMGIEPEIPNFGSINFIKTFKAHLANLNYKVKDFFEVAEGSILAPYNVLTKVSAWREVPGIVYSYDPEKIKKHAFNVDTKEDAITPFFKLLVSIQGVGYLQSPNSLLALLSAFMIDPDYLNDYCGYLSAMTGLKTNVQPVRPEYINNIIYKGCFRVLFNELDGSVFSILNNQCKCAYVANKKIGFVMPNTDVLTAKNFLWLLSYIGDNQSAFFSNNALMAKLIMYFEPKVNPNEVPRFLNILHRLPEITVEEENSLLKSGFGNLFRKIGSRLSQEDDEGDMEDPNESTEEEDETQTDEEGGEEDAEPSEDDDMGFGDDVDFGDDTSDSGGEDAAGSDEGSEGEDSSDTSTDSSETPSENLPEYAFKLGAPPELDSAIYRLEVDRKITQILKDPPSNISGKILKLMRNLQAYWLHLINLDTLKRIINIINQGVKQ